MMRASSFREGFLAVTASLIVPAVAQSAAAGARGCGLADAL
jgi:hypothetical protein